MVSRFSLEKDIIIRWWWCLEDFNMAKWAYVDSWVFEWPFYCASVAFKLGWPEERVWNDHVLRRKFCVVAFIPIIYLHTCSELWWRVSRVIPRNPQVKMVSLWPGIEIITFELEIPWGSRNVLPSTQQLYGDTPMMTRIGTVQPWLSGPRLSGTSIIRTCSRPANTLVRMRSGCGQWYWRGVATVERWAWQFYRVVLAKTGWPVYLYDCYWLWSCYMFIIYRLGIINQVRKAGTSVIPSMPAISPWTKGSG